jgi:hypothetical protein
MRVTGLMELVDDDELTQKVATDRSFLDQLAGQPTAPLTRVFRLCHGEAHFWMMSDILKESQLERVQI